VNRLASGAIGTAKLQHGAEAKQPKPWSLTGENNEIRQTVNQLILIDCLFCSAVTQIERKICSLD
jgi:hypothetical protein